MVKPKNISIETIQVVPSSPSSKARVNYDSIYGLGSDDKVYYWSVEQAEWYLYSANQES